MAYSCTVCNTNIISISGLCTHIRIFHPELILSSYDCPLCTRRYSTLQYFREHLKKQHPEEGDADGIPNDLNDNVDDDLLGEDLHELPPRADFQEPGEQRVTLLDFKMSLYKSSLALTAKLYSLNSLNRTQIQEIISIVSDFTCNGFLDVLKDKTFSLLRNGNNEANEDLQDLAEMFKTMEDPFCGLKTENQRLSALEQSNCFIRPQSYVIGEGEQVRNVNGQAVITPVERTGQYISMKEVLKQFLQLPGVLTDTLNNVNRLKNEEVFSNVVQSPLWKEIESTHFRDRVVLPLNLYFDEAEPDNQTGSHAGSHKLGMVYYHIPCIPQHLLSLLENTFVASVFLSNDRAADNAAAFHPIINDLKDLETTGITIHSEEGDHQIFFALCHVLGDNLGVNSILGYVESFSATYFCRLCKERKEVTRVQLRENRAMLRTTVNYQLDILINDYSQTGLKRECIWNQLICYHVTINVALDIMHDFLEGVCHYDLCAIISEFLSNEFFTLDTLNERIQNFHYGFDAGNKPTAISIDHLRNEKLKMSASEMFFFVRHFGLIIGDLVPEGTEAWKLYLYLVDILDIVCAPYVSPDSEEFLATLIAEHHAIYINVFHKTLKPKHHFMLHYPRVMSFVRPIIHLWCMRLEAKHRPVVKQSARSHTSRKNLPLTTALRYSLGLCARILGKRGFPQDVSFHPHELHVRDVENFEDFENILPPDYENCSIVERATICGTLYCRNMVLVINSENDFPLFSVLQWIVKPMGQDERAWFIMSGLHTVGFNYHMHCYEVRPTAEWFFVEYHELISFYPSMCRFGADGCQYVTFRHEL